MDDLTHKLPSSKHRTLVILGDSIVYGWGVMRRDSYVHLLQEDLAHDPRLSDWRVIGAGVPGDTALMGLARFCDDVAVHNPDAVIIAFGLNDGALSRSSIDQQREHLFLARTQPWWRAWFLLRRLARLARRMLSLKPRRGLPVVHEAEPRVRPTLFQAGLRSLMRATRQLGARPMLLALLPRDETKLGARQRATYQAYAADILALAEETDTPLIALERPEDGPIYHMPDGVHLLPAGHRWLATQVYTQLLKVFTT